MNQWVYWGSLQDRGGWGSTGRSKENFKAFGPVSMPWFQSLPHWPLQPDISSSFWAWPKGYSSQDSSLRLTTKRCGMMSSFFSTSAKRIQSPFPPEDTGAGHHLGWRSQTPLNTKNLPAPCFGLVLLHNAEKYISITYELLVTQSQGFLLLLFL